MFEAEDTVKGLPDDYLFNEAKYPSGQLPQFLVVSEIQRRQSMRARHETYSPQPEGTVKDQILGQQAPQAPQAAPQAPQGIAAAAMAQAPGQGMQQPQQPVQMAHGGIAPGGKVYMANLGEVPFELSPPDLPQKKTPFGRTLYRLADAYKGWVNDIASDRADISALSVRRQNDLAQLSESYGLGAAFRNTSEGDWAAAKSDFEKIRGMSRDEYADYVAKQEEEQGLRKPTPFNTDTADNMSADSFKQSKANQSPAWFRGFAAPEGEAAPPDTPPATSPEDAALASRINSGLGGLNFSSDPGPRVKAYDELLERQSKSGVPPPVDLQKYMDAANQRGEDSSEYARQMAIAQALTGLGSGLMAGTPDLGMKQASDDVFSTLGAGREEANTERRAAEQIGLQQATQSRQHQLDAMAHEREISGERASIETAREDKEVEFGLKKLDLDLRRIYYETAAGGGEGATQKAYQKSLDAAANRASDAANVWRETSGIGATDAEYMAKFESYYKMYSGAVNQQYGIATPEATSAPDLMPWAGLKE